MEPPECDLEPAEFFVVGALIFATALVFFFLGSCSGG